MQRHQWVLHRWMQQIKLVRVRCLVLQREQQDLLQCRQRVWPHQQGSHLVVVVVAANQGQANRTDRQQAQQQIMRHDHRQPVQVVLRQPRPLVISSAYLRNQMVMLDLVRVQQRQEDLQARVNVVALQTLRLHQQVVRARAQRMLMAVQESVRPQCSVIYLVALQQVMLKAQQLKVVRDLQVVAKAQRVAQLR